MIGREYNAPLPPFRGGSDARGLALRAEPDPPEGLVFTDAGGGLSLLSGAPTRPGVYSFEVVSSDSNGSGGRMMVKLTVAPAPDSAAGRAEKVPAFLKAYDGGACFAARLRSGAAGANSIEAVGAERAAFSRLDAAFKRETGIEPLINAKQIAPQQCPIVALIKVSDGAREPPAIALDSPDVGPGRPLAGRVSGLAGRHLVLVVVDNDGDAVVLPSKLDPDGGGASFKMALTGTTDSIGPLQILAAIVSDSPLALFDRFHSGTASDLASRLQAEWPRAGAIAEVAYFKLAR
jgi:serine/threonine-protein kinase